tara:strand:+ start:1572 stop:2675 length:1104 start_codon:yes stop_codon:yes gene_type:complete
VNKKRILIVSNNSKYLSSHRGKIISYLADKYKVSICSPKSKIYFKKYFCHENFVEGGYNGFFYELKKLFKLIKIIKSDKPDLIYVISIKPCLCILILNFFLRYKVLYSITGLGYIFSDNSNFFLKSLVKFSFKIFNIKKNYFIFQNKYELNFFRNLINIYQKSYLISGTGIETKIKKRKINYKKLRIILPSRMLYDKGIRDFVNISQIVNRKFKNTFFYLIGGTDKNNPMNIGFYEIKNILKDKNRIEWLGYKKNLNKIFRNAFLTCFPSYHEGSPRTLIESSSYGVPIVCYDIPGNRNIVKNNFNGYRVKIYNYNFLAKKIENIIYDKQLYKQMCKNSIIISKKFNHNLINNKFNKIVSKIINAKN